MITLKGKNIIKKKKTRKQLPQSRGKELRYIVVGREDAGKIIFLNLDDINIYVYFVLVNVYIYSSCTFQDMCFIFQFKTLNGKILYS